VSQSLRERERERLAVTENVMLFVGDEKKLYH
jgi:hypothetical protein